MTYQDELALLITNTIFERYPAIRQDYLEFTKNDEADDVLPSIATPERLKDLIGLANVHLLLEHADGMSYVGLNSDAPGKRKAAWA